MPQSHKISFFIILALIFLLPLFFVPGGALYLDTAKSALLALGVVAATIAFLYDLWKEGRIKFPKSYFLLISLLLPVVYLISALLATPSSLSLFGYSLEIGTFGHIMLGAAVLILSSLIFEDTSRVLQALVAFFISISLLGLFMLVKIILGGDALAWGQFFTNMGNPLGNWTDLAIVFGLLSVFVTLVLGMLPMKLGVKALLYAVFILSTFLLVVISFSVAFVFTLITSALLFAYFLKVEKPYDAPNLAEAKEKNIFARPTFLPAILALISVVFLINPNLPGTGEPVGSIVSEKFKIENTEVRPSFSATLSVSKAVLSEGALLGSGPNTFSRDWLIYRPMEVNATPFWSVAFPSGIGFIPTQVATTGILGTVLWILFLVFLAILGVKAITRIPDSRAERFTLVASFFLTFFLWIASLLYVPSATVLVLGFIFAGIFVATLAKSSIIGSKEVMLKATPQIRSLSFAALLLITAGAVAIAWFGLNKTVSAYHFKRAIDLSNIVGTPLIDVENAVDKAISISPADIHYIALSRINFAKAQMAANSTEGSAEENRKLFEESVRKSIEAARAATAINPAGYQNWVTLGMVYAALVPAPLSVEGAYENAQFAYNEALQRNPNNPELPLLLARLELSKGDTEKARSFIRNSIALKEDYADAYLMLAQLETEEGNTLGAISSVEKLTNLRPDNPGIHFELGLLKYSSRDYEDAVQALNRALALSPDYANAKYYLGLSLAQLKRFDEAKLEFEELLLTNPDSAEVKAAIKAVSEKKVPANPK